MKIVLAFWIPKTMLNVYELTPVKFRHFTWYLIDDKIQYNRQMANFVCENEKINEIKYEINATYNLTLWCKQSIIVMSSNFSVAFTHLRIGCWQLEGSRNKTKRKRKKWNESADNVRKAKNEKRKVKMLKKNAFFSGKMSNEIQKIGPKRNVKVCFWSVISMKLC